MRDDDVFVRLEALTGISRVALDTQNRRVTAGIGKMERRVDSLLTTQRVVDRALRNNQIANTDSKPSSDNTFVYFDLSCSVQVIAHVGRIRLRVQKTLGPAADIRFTDVRRQHCTAFVANDGRDLGEIDARVETVAARYAHMISSLRPFVLWVRGPYVSDNGVVLECSTAADTINCLRGNVERAGQNDPSYRPHFIPEILHSTVAYLAKADVEKLRELRGVFDHMRRRVRPLPVYVQEVRVGGTMNKRAVGPYRVITLSGRPALEITSSESASTMLNRLAATAETWGRDRLTAMWALEAGILWSALGGPNEFQAANRLIDALPEFLDGRLSR